MDDRLPQLLAERLSLGLAVPPADGCFQPQPQLWRYYDAPRAEARPAAVLVLLYPSEGKWHVPLTLRPDHMIEHGGQISLPGGTIEPGETGGEAAIREFHEELGAADARIELLGRLSPLYVQGSNYQITPWVGVADCRPSMVPFPGEVEALLEIPLPHFLDPANLDAGQREYRGQTYRAPHFLWRSHRIWGATCMILGELVTVVREIC